MLKKSEKSPRIPATVQSNQKSYLALLYPLEVVFVMSFTIAVLIPALVHA